MRNRVSKVSQLLIASAMVACASGITMAQQTAQRLDENCTVSVLNRTVRVNPDGSWVLPNIPANFGQIKARATCVKNGATTFGESDFFAVPANGAANLPAIFLGSTSQIPSLLSITPGTLSFTSAGQTIQLNAKATYPDNTTKDVTSIASGTNYTTSNPAIATVNANGLVTALASGTVVIQATNDGTGGIITANIILSGADSDGDGIPDDAEIRLGLDPKNPVDAQEDFDRDGLTNLQEFSLGTDIRNADTDGDGLSDDAEVNNHHTNPLLADTDGDSIPDDVEVQNGTNPLDKSSYDLKKATSSSIVRPSSFVLTTSILFPIASQQLSWKVNLTDGKTTLDLTADPRTSYASSDLTICNFGAQRGLVLAGNPGSCTITISNNTLNVTVSATVQSFTPQALSFVDIPGFANNVDVSGNYAYVAAGSGGLQVVDVSDHAHPHVVASRSLPGNANDVIVVGNYAYVAAGSAGLQIVNISDPLVPVVSGSLNTGGVAWDVMVKGSKAYVANGAGGLVIIDVSTPSSPTELGSFSLPGTAKGVDVDVMRQIAAVALGTGGLAVVNVANPVAPVLLATLPGGDLRDLAISGNYAFLADFSRSFTSVDLTNASTPVLRASVQQNLGGLLQDVAVEGTLATGADVFFINGVPIIDVSVPASPQPRIILDFRSFRDDNGTGIAMDQNYVYLTAESGAISENGVSGTTRLYIGQYRNIQDNIGTPPTVQITSPVSGARFPEGSPITITATATDDVAVKAVSFYIDGQLVFKTSTAPYQYTFTAPFGRSILTFGATAEDFGANVGQAPNVTINLTPVPKTTVTGRVLNGNRTPIAGADISLTSDSGGEGPGSIIQGSATTGADGIFTINNVPAIYGNIVANASITVGGLFFSGKSASTTPVADGATDVGDIVLTRGLRVAVFGAPGVLPGDGTVPNIAMNNDVRDKLISTGLFAKVDATLVQGDLPIPTLDQLQQYDAVLVYSNAFFSNRGNLGNVLADYIERGGGVVLATFAFYSQPGIGIQGRIETAGYLPFTKGGFASPGGQTLVAVEPQHEILKGVTSFNGGSSSFQNTPISTTSGTTLVAQWSNGQPLVGAKALPTGRVVGLNFYPPSSDVGSGLWLSNTSGARLMANSLVWTASR